MFKLFKKKDVWKTSCEKLAGGEMSVQEFVNKNADKKLYYSTPMGENKDGKPQVWILSNKESPIHYYPAFSSAKGCQTFFPAIGREAFMIIEGDLQSLLKSLDVHEMLKQCGAVIDPHSDAPIALPPNIRVEK